MANSRATSQQSQNVTLNKAKLLKIAANEDLSKKDLKVLLCLFTQLEGYLPPKVFRISSEDPRNFRKIDIKTISDTTGLTKKEVKKSIELLEDCVYLESGDSDVLKNGYRFTF